MAEDVRVVLDAMPREQGALGDPGDQAVDSLVRGHRRADVEVDRERLPSPGEVHQHGAAAPDRAHERLDHGHRERRRDGGVHRVAAAVEDARADLGPERVLRDHDAAPGQRGALRDVQGRADHR